MHAPKNLHAPIESNVLSFNSFLEVSYHPHMTSCSSAFYTDCLTTLQIFVKNWEAIDEWIQASNSIGYDCIKQNVCRWTCFRKGRGFIFFDFLKFSTFTLVHKMVIISRNFQIVTDLAIVSFTINSFEYCQSPLKRVTHTYKGSQDTVSVVHQLFQTGEQNQEHRWRFLLSLFDCVKTQPVELVVLRALSFRT